MTDLKSGLEAEASGHGAMKVVSCLVFAAVASAGVAPAQAADEGAEKAVEQEASRPSSEVVVTATRGNSLVGQTPAKVTIISREEIVRQLSTTSDRGQILSNLIPGYSPSRQKLTNSGETFRGREALVMIDGVPQSNPLRDSARDGYTIDLAMVERIEVIHGASAEHGLGATGGIINYVTKRAEGDALEQRLAVDATLADDLKSDGMGHKLAYQVSGRNADWDYFAAASRQERGIFYDAEGRTIGLDEISGDIQDTSTYSVFGKLGYRIDADQNLMFSLNHFELDSNADYVAVPGDRSQGIPTTSQPGTPPNDPAYNHETMANLLYENGGWLGNRVAAQLYRQKFRAQFGTHPFAFPYSDVEGNSRLDQTRTESDKLGAKFTLVRDDLFDDRLKLTTGLDVIRDETRQVLVQTGRTYVPLSTLENAAGFLQAEVKATDALSLHVGQRYEYAQIQVDDFTTIDRSNVTQDLVDVNGGSPDFTEPLSNAGVVYWMNDTFQVFANFSEGFGIPDVGRVFRGIDQPGRDVDTLVNLEPIVTDNREIGFRADSERYGFEVSYYESDSDFGERLTQEGGTFVGKRERVEIRGVDVNGHYRLSGAHLFKFIYAYNEGESDTDGDGVVDTGLTGFNVAPERLTLNWQGQWGAKLSSSVNVSHYFDDTFEDQANPNLSRFNGYDLIGVSLAYQLPAGDLSFGVDNLLNEEYVTYYSQTARDGDQQYFSGRGRTWKLGYSLEF